MPADFPMSIMDSIEPFVFLLQYQIVVCQKCGFGVVSKEVSTHLREHHRDIAIPDRKRLAIAIAKLPGIIQDQAGLSGFLFPSPSIGYIPQLALPQTDGLKCRKCPYVARQLQKIHAHCRTCQGWTNNRGAGRPDLKRKRLPADTSEELSELPWRENVACQRFFPSRRASAWFEVERKSLPALAQVSETVLVLLLTCDIAT
jgi:hypothetical protein